MALSFYEYGIVVATSDDKLVSRKKQSYTARDNVLFEFGLFMGRLGKQKSFLIKEKGIKIPSDLLGIELLEFTDRNAPDINLQIEACCRSIIFFIKSRSGIFDGGMYPSIPLAYGYYHNSLCPAARHLRINRTVRAKGEEMILNSFQFRILIPDDLRNDMKDKVELKKSDDKWIQLEIPTSATRSFNFYILESDWGKTDLDIYDIPTTLNSLYQTIKEFAGSNSLGRTVQEEQVEQREIRHFKKVVDYLIAENNITKNLVTTEIVDI